MDNHQFERLLHEIVGLRERTDGLAEGQQKLAERTDQRFERLLHEIAELRERTDGVAEGLRELREEARSWVDEARRHFQVLAEDLRSVDRLLAEGLAAVNERLDRVKARLEAKMDSGFEATHALIRFSYRDLDRRVSTLEGSAPS
jgi:uncharacterized coiled-coil DUF342 family protein